MELLQESLLTLTLNKLRTGLAMLGIVIGIGSVIALISLGQATQQQVANQIQSLGANLLTVSPGGQSTGAVRGAQGSGTTLTLDDANGILTSPQITTIDNVSPETTSRAQVTTGQTNTNVQVIGVTDAYSTVHKTNVSEGTFISKSDVTGLRKVAVVGPQVVTDLFNGEDPIGKTIRINGQTLTIIGVTESKGGTGFLNQDDIVFVPLSTAQKQLFGQNYLSSISVEAKSPDVMEQARDEVGYYLLARHKISDPTQADFSIFSQEDILNTASSVTGTFTALLSGIAAISLLVGGIGIMNIMLVSVTERTREIGLRKALGAKKNIIVSQFLIESVILTLIGGAIGMVIGIIISFAIASLAKLPVVISPEAILLAVGVSGGIGIIFGWYPARRAAGLQPIEALRYE
ncbi:MAG TPA: ABC transporter permease [Patescibacteria group bacterium]|nr:ABC transporter permease [Patescibacteria group bacterium]